MSALLVSCRRCFALYEVSRDDILQGPRWWSICPDCRTADALELPRRPGEKAIGPPRKRRFPR